MINFWTFLVIIQWITLNLSRLLIKLRSTLKISTTLKIIFYREGIFKSPVVTHVHDLHKYFCTNNISGWGAVVGGWKQQQALRLLLSKEAIHSFTPKENNIACLLRGEIESKLHFG